MKLKAFIVAVAICCAKADAQQVSTNHPDKQAISLEGHEWTIAGYFVHQEPLFPHEQLLRVQRPYIGFVDGILQGSPGCGQFSGTYLHSGNHFVLDAKWSDDVKAPCNEGQKDDAAKMLEAFRNVRLIGEPPDYWQDDSVILTNEKNEIQITLAPKRTGADFEDLQYSYWRPKEINGHQANFSSVVIYIGQGDVGISTPTCLYKYPFEYEISGLRFSPAWTYGCEKVEGAVYDLNITTVFEKSLHSMASYRLQGDILTLFDKNRNSLAVLNSLKSTGIENRDWRISKYRVPNAQTKDKNGLIDAKIFSLVTFVNGRLDGSLGCGGLMGSYKLSGSQLKLEGGTMLAGLCDGESAAQNGSIEKYFRQQMRIEETNGHILLLDAKGEPQIVLDPL